MRIGRTNDFSRKYFCWSFLDNEEDASVNILYANILPCKSLGLSLLSFATFEILTVGCFYIFCNISEECGDSNRNEGWSQNSVLSCYLPLEPNHSLTNDNFIMIFYILRSNSLNGLIPQQFLCSFYLICIAQNNSSLSLTTTTTPMSYTLLLKMLKSLLVCVQYYSYAF